jgi:hypothetical protein
MMTWQFDENNVVLIANDIGIEWILWKDLGVTHSVLEVLGSGDGLAAFENSGQTAGPNYDVLSGGTSVWNSSVANEFSNPNAWLRVRIVGTTFEFMIKRATTSTASLEDDFQVLISPTGFSSGGASATVRPTATDEQYILGSAPSTFAAFGVYNIDTRLHVGIDDSSGSAGFHSFYIYHVNETTDQIISGFAFDAVAQLVVGDLQPWVAYLAGIATPFTASNIGGLLYGKCYRDYGGGSELFTTVRGHYLVDSNNNKLLPGSIPPQAEDSESRSFPVVWGNAAINFYKGVTSFLEWKGTSSRGYPDTVDIATSSAKIYVDEIMIPWKQNITPL